jgi:hypothetical protein
MTYFTGSEELEDSVLSALEELSAFEELIAASDELVAPTSEELVFSSAKELEDSSGKAASLLELSPNASADESGLVDCITGNCGFESLPQLAQKNDATVKQLRRQNLRIFIKFLLLLSNI